MGLEGQVKLGRRKELAAIEDPDERLKIYEIRLRRCMSAARRSIPASLFELDDVIDPAETRKWVISGLNSVPPPAPRTGKKRPFVDGW